MAGIWAIRLGARLVLSSTVMFSRRGFLKTLLAGTAGFALDPERLLWVPGRVATFDLGAVPAMADTRLIDGLLKEIYMPGIVEMMNDATWRPYLGLARELC